MWRSQRLAADWSAVPLELLEIIYKSIGEIADRMRFGAVCQSWRSASKSAAADLPPHRLPWLLLPPTAFGDDAVRSFFSLSSTKLYSLNLPETGKKLVFCSPHGGWLLLITTGRGTHKATPSMFNPITKATITFPPVALDHEVSRCKLFVTRESHAVMVALASGAIHCCCREDGRWMKINVCDRYRKSRDALDFAYHNGSYFLLIDQESIVSVDDKDWSQAAVVAKVPPVVPTGSRQHVDTRAYFVRRWYLVASWSGEELYLVRAPSRSGKEKFEVFRLDQDEGRAWWRRVRSIGGDILFVDDRQAIALPAAGGGRLGDGWRENCIVFLDYVEVDRSNSSAAARDGLTRLRLFDIRNDAVHQLRCWNKNLRLQRPVGWFLPTM